MVRILLLLIVFLLSPQHVAYAHVKWFSQFSFDDKPLTLAETLNPVFYVMMALSVIVIALLVILDQKIEKSKAVVSLKQSLERYSSHSVTIMRAAAAAVLLLCFQAGSLFVPELKIDNQVVVWLQFFFAIFLLFPKTMVISGLGIIALFVYGLVQFGLFHMLDYVLFLGVGYYLAVSANKANKIKESGLVALYLTGGFSLCWVAIEKLLYPQWSLYILEQNPQLALGLNFDFFLTAAAFIEFSLGYLMIICLLQRPLALVVTVVFFMTTLVFGKTEVIGHTIIHAALVVFLIEGSGRFFRTPINLHNKLSLKIAFAVVNFILLLFALLVPYQRIAQSQHDDFIQMRNSVAVVDTTSWKNPPSLKINAFEDNHAGWNLQLQVEHFTFSPAKSGAQHVQGEGHAHLYVNGQKKGRIYGRWYYLSDLIPGNNTIKVTLNSNDHKLLMYKDKAIESQIILEVPHHKMSKDHQ